MIRWITADVFDGLATLDDGSVDLVVTSPPFLALRSYLPADHPDKGKEIGSEANPAEFLDVMLRVTAELRRVLAPHGSICIELGDTYAGGGGTWDDIKRPHEGEGTPIGGRIGQGWPLTKSKTLIPELYRIALAYGTNPLTGAESPAGRWRIRNVVTWARPNPPVGALGDKWRPATSDVVVACVSEKRYWDDLATRREAATGYEVKRRSPTTTAERGGARSGGMFGGVEANNPAGAPLLDWWEIPPGGYKGSHYAVFPPALVEPLIKAMAPPKVCRQCGEPSRRIVGDITLDSYRNSDRTQTKRAVALADEHGLTDAHIAAVRAFGTSDAGKAQHINNGAGKNTDEVKALAAEAKEVLGGYFREFVMNTNADRITTGWTDCGHGSIVCRACNGLVPYDGAVRRPRKAPPIQGGVGQEEVLGEPVQGPDGQTETPEGVRGLRSGLSGEDDGLPGVQPFLFGEAGPHGGADELIRSGPEQSSMEGRQEGQPPGLRPGVGAGGVSGETEERLHDGASPSDAGASRPTPGTVGVGTPPERGEGGQPDRESGDSDPRQANGRGDLPELQSPVPGALEGYVCPCGSSDLKYVADHYRPGLVLDPFAGSGTTIQVAHDHGRDAIGIDLDERNRELAEGRIGPLVWATEAEAV